MTPYASLRHSSQTGPEAALAALRWLRSERERREGDRWNLIPIDALGRYAGNAGLADRLDIHCAALAGLELAHCDERRALLEELVAGFVRSDRQEAAIEAFGLLLGEDPLRDPSPAWLAPSPARSGFAGGAFAPGPLRLSPTRTLRLPGGGDVRHLCSQGDALVLLTNTAPRTLMIVDGEGATRGAVAFSRPPNSVFPARDGQIGVCDQDGYSVHWYDRDCRLVKTLDLRDVVRDGSQPKPLYGCCCGERSYLVVNRGASTGILCCETGADSPAAAYLDDPNTLNFLKIFSQGGHIFAATSGHFFHVFTPSRTTLGLDLAARVPLYTPPYHFAFAANHVFCSSKDWLYILDDAFHLAGKLRVDARIFPETPPPGRWPVLAATTASGETHLWLTLVLSNRLQGYAIHA
jgi:hypothetical protein